MPALAQSATALNSQGVELLRVRKYAEAIEKFQQAIGFDESHALAHYNFAATLARVRSQGAVCEFSAYRATIISELQRSIELDPRRRERALVDKDFKTVHDTLGWQFIAGKTVEKNAAEILQAVTWYGPAPGAFGPVSGVRFERGGKVSSWVLDLSGDSARRVFSEGWKWTVSGVTVTIESSTRTGEQPRCATWTLGASGLVATTPGDPSYTDDPDECSA
jgi:tetratricopeptide (TPR) repeat protein